MILAMILTALGGLAIFLFGMNEMSQGMQALAGPRLSKMINLATTNRFAGCAVGTGVTCLVQSSSVTTVMVVGLVNVGLMTLTQAIGVILGANIGTTITGWILTLKIGKYGLEMIGLFGLVYLFSKNERARSIGMFVFGMGMVFFGLDIMKEAFKPLRDSPEFIEWFSRFSPTSYWGVLKTALVGAVLTAIVQSSSATLGITIGLATTGIIDFPTAAALVLGENIGTTITAYLASIGASVNAKRASLSHIFINLLGVAWISPFFTQYTEIIQNLVGGNLYEPVMADGLENYPRLGPAIALSHSGFNIVNVVLFLPFVNGLALLVSKILPEKQEKEVTHLKYLDVRMLTAPPIAIVESQSEILRMGQDAHKMMDWLGDMLEKDDVDEVRQKKIFHREEILDIVQKEITEFLSQLLASPAAHNVVDECTKQIRMADEYESVGDYTLAIYKHLLKAQKEDIPLPDADRTELKALHKSVNDYLEMIYAGVKQNKPEIISKAHVLGDQITVEMKEYRNNHLERVGAGGVSPMANLLVTDMLNAYRRIKDHALNIAEALAGEK